MNRRLPVGSPSSALASLSGSGERHGFRAAITVPNRVEAVRPTTAFLVQSARALNIAAAASPLFEVAVAEALTNAVKHGHGRVDRGIISCELELDPGQLTIRIEDEGPGFAIPAQVMPSALPVQVDALAESGYGLRIIRSVFPVVRGSRVNRGFRLELAIPRI
jgi:anti-sigma regulatory factor (Ser/Thr protein kinase)